MFDKLIKRFRRRTDKKSKEMKENERRKLMEEKKKKAGEALVKKVAKLDVVLASKLNNWKQEMDETNARLQQNITELQASLKLCEEREMNIIRFEASMNLLEERKMTKDLERENLMRDRKRLQKRVEQLEATQASEREQHKQEKVKMEENTTALLQNIIRCETSLNLLEEREKTKDLERESLLRDREQLQKRVDQLEATLASEREQQEQEKEKLQENTTALLQNIIRFETSLNLLEEREKTKDLERESLLRDREQLQKRVDQLEATLASEQEQQEQEKEKIEENTTDVLQNITNFDTSMNLLQEWVKTRNLERESLLRDREQLQKCVDQLEATLASEREQQEQEKEKIEENTTALLQNVTRLEDSVKLFEEREKINILERESLLRDRERLQKCVDQLEATRALELEQQEQDKEDIEEHTTALLQNITWFEASLDLLEEQEKTVILERESLRRDQEQLQKCADQLEATVDSEREQQKQEREEIEKTTAALLQDIAWLEASLDLLEEREETNEHSTTQDFCLDFTKIQTILLNESVKT
ncbi:hypothetical protein KOW79_001066 [Hemibagrus wyckioides]|uniref:Uncharacterized protein n=1 Tax=Hemibagrus wyckioides TaxID=337641 RepID=A0A9D3PBJ7_9TELE|nr:hypothetical protein KOW79_001066 [Hemibagrus wyckioides]